MMKIKTVKLSLMLMAASLTLVTVSCTREGCTDPLAPNYDAKAKKDDGSCIVVVPSDGTIPKSGAISSDETWTADNIYKLEGKVVVESGVTLTIEPGTIIKGAEGTETLASALVVAQGGTLIAVGTPLAPIIFTSILDNIQIGQMSGTNLDENDKGLWGGVIVLGYAPISAADGDALAQIEGIPVSDAFGAFGGSDAGDNSGTLAYISIRHGGALIGAGNEINGLTLGGVGTGTSITNIEVVSNLDDGIEFFGGTVNVTNVLIGFQGDDGLDVDMNYSGTVTNFTVVSGIGSDEGLEIDGPEGSTYTAGLFTLTDGHAYVYGGAATSGDFKSKAQGTLNNVIFGTGKIRASYQNNCMDPKEDSYTHLSDVSPTLIFNGCQFDGVTVYTASIDDLGGDCTLNVPADQTTAEGIMVSGSATGSDITSFGWTWMSVNGKI